MLKLDISKLDGFVAKSEFEAMFQEIEVAHKKLYDKSAPGSEFTGWVNLPENYDRDEFERIQAAAEKIRSNSEVLVVIGIGGSYLGAKAALEIFKPKGIEICFAGNSLSPNSLQEVMNTIGSRDFSVNVISKSGGTTEPAIAFRLFRDLLEKRYGARAKDRIYATTDKKSGALKALADKNGWATFVVPDDIGGRYSVLTAVGLLPLAAGWDGCCSAHERCCSGEKEVWGARRPKSRVAVCCGPQSALPQGKKS